MAAKAKKTSQKTPEKQKVSVARQEDGEIQLTLVVPWVRLEKEMESQVKEMGKTITVPGFRKGKAPIDRVTAHISKDELVERVLHKILPEMFGKAIEEHKIRPVMYPKFEIVKAEEGEDWQIRAVTCELGEIKLGDYKSQVRGALRAKAIWTPDAAKAAASGEGKEELTPEEKEQLAIEALLKSVEMKLPEILVNREVESKLAGLLERLEKLGLSLESYLSSTGKTPEQLREEYKDQAERTLKLEIILNKVAEEEKITVGEEEIMSFIKAAKADPNLGDKLDGPEQKRIIGSILRKRKVLDGLAALV